jgi:hypothetical protein
LTYKRLSRYCSTEREGGREGRRDGGGDAQGPPLPLVLERIAGTRGRRTRLLIDEEEGEGEGEDEEGLRAEEDPPWS